MTTRHEITANSIIEENPNAPVMIKMTKMSKGYIDKWHKHSWHQIIFPIQGILQTKVVDTQFIVPHNGAVFIPANTEHESFVMIDTTFIGIYLNPEKNKEYPLDIKCIAVEPFFRELILYLQKITKSADKNIEIMVRLLDVLFDQVGSAETFNLQLALPKDRRLRIIFDMLNNNPQLATSLPQWAEKVGASERTLSRLFMKELNMSFPLWRRHLRLVKSLHLLEASTSIQEVAYDVGYNSDSTFIAAFKNTFNQTPQQFRNNGFIFSSATDVNAVLIS
jgi:AraC-like DNA-binding protein/quercetin dioxygenase-like cupin family protein